MIERKEYLDELVAWKDEKVIKVVTGMRRSGKSTLLMQFQDLLIKGGIDESQIISLNFEELENDELLDYKNLYAYIEERINPERKHYIFLDEIQRVSSYENVVDSLYEKENIDIYITSSNSYMLSGEFATLLAGRYVEIKMLPFSFREFSEVIGKTDDAALSEYMKVGGLPYSVLMEGNDEKLSVYLEGIYNTVIVKDIEERQTRKEIDPKKRKVSDIVLLKNIARYMASVVGSPISTKRVTDYLTSSGRKVSANTVDDYMDALCEACVFYKVNRFDIIGKEVLKTNAKYYIVDLGIRNHILPISNYDLGFSLENIIFFELIRRGYKVNVGKFKDTEVDFVVQKNDDIIYYQVTEDMTHEGTFEREMRPLRTIKDNYQKIVLTLDRFTLGNYEGIRVINAIDWLLKK